MVLALPKRNLRSPLDPLLVLVVEYCQFPEKISGMSIGTFSHRMAMAFGIYNQLRSLVGRQQLKKFCRLPKDMLVGTLKKFLFHKSTIQQFAYGRGTSEDVQM